MNAPPPTPTGGRRRAGRNPGSTPWIIALVLVALVAVLGWWRPPFVERWLSGDGEEGESSTVQENQAPDESESVLEAPDPLIDRWTDTLGRMPSWPDDWSRPVDCTEVDTDLDVIAGRLDGRPGRAEELPVGGSRALLERVAGKWLAQPPAISGELRDPRALIANLTHLRRALGDRDLQLVRQLLREEQDNVEPIAFAVYRWAASRETCGGPPEIDRRARYAYASFLFDTFGGQAYLRRRSPRVEALASFYALLTLESADLDGYNPRGLDLRPEIARTRQLVAGAPLARRDEYLDALDRMQGRWQGRGGS